MRAKEIINELFNKPLQWKWLTVSDELFTAVFEIEGKVYNVRFNNEFDESWKVDFLISEFKKGTKRSNYGYLYNNTETGNEFLVFSTVIDVIKTFLVNKKPNSLSFIATKNSKYSLYKKIMSRLSQFFKSIGYVVSETPNSRGDEINFFITKIIEGKQMKLNEIEKMTRDNASFIIKASRDWLDRKDKLKDLQSAEYYEGMETDFEAIQEEMAYIRGILEEYKMRFGFQSVNGLFNSAKRLVLSKRSVAEGMATQVRVSDGKRTSSYWVAVKNKEKAIKKAKALHKKKYGIGQVIRGRPMSNAELTAEIVKTMER